MNVEWMNHTGFVVSDMERSLVFYRDQLGLEIERDQVLEGEFISELVGYPDAKLHIIYLGLGDSKHSVELIEYLNPR
ncbi:MAG: VOC family protein, partial [Chloroflexota bacterium]|nr:VOC family protein [Chloroflexota bacterium]